jgi:hypothetical protein
VVLDGTDVGSFQVILELPRLSRDCNSGCFRCVAREPNPAQSDSSVTHPHVRDEVLCAGDAATAITSALAQGRICDAFLLVVGVLRHYNPESPYTSLDHWNGSPCPDCGETCSPGDFSFCDGCDREVCDGCSGCSGCCQVCDRCLCRGCLEHDAVEDKDCCARCYERCRSCQRVVACPNLDTDTQLCPGCPMNDSARVLPCSNFDVK